MRTSIIVGGIGIVVLIILYILFKRKDGFYDKQISPLNFVSVPRYGNITTHQRRENADISTGGTYTIWK